MKSFLLPSFISLYRELPRPVRTQARHAYELFRHDPQQPGLRFRQVHPVRPIFSARVRIHYRVVGVRDGNSIYWFWIGSHADYDRLLRQL